MQTWKATINRSFPLSPYDSAVRSWNLISECTALFQRRNLVRCEPSF